MTITPGRLTKSLGACAAFMAAVPNASLATTSVSVAADPAPAQAGQPAALIVRVSSSAAIYGYTLRIRLTPQEDATGTLKLDAADSTFGDPEALIAEASRAEGFTEIKMLDGDLVATTNTKDQSTVKPADKRDVLVRAALTASADATGTWKIEFISPVSVLSDGSLQAIETQWPTSTVEVVPPPAAAGCCCAAAPVLGVLFVGAAVSCHRPVKA